MAVILKREPKISYNCWSLRKIFRWINGVTLGHHILFKRPKADIQPWLIDHERKHVWQIEKYGVIKFYLTYLWYQVRYGYEKNPYEIEARSVEISTGG